MIIPTYRDAYKSVSILENRPPIGQPRGLPYKNRENVGAGLVPAQTIYRKVRFQMKIAVALVMLLVLLLPGAFAQDTRDGVCLKVRLRASVKVK